MNLLGWMRAPQESLAQWDDHVALAAAARAAGLTRSLVCGMGGSSLVADVLAETFGARDLHVLDSTNPEAVRAAGSASDLARTLFVISSKSGNTVETLAFCHYFGAHARPEQFVAITETDSPLAQIANARGFRAVIPHPLGVGGRYSALTAIGMVPAALAQLDGRTLLERTRRVD
jgi:glucose-6-phosphate isomerase